MYYTVAYTEPRTFLRYDSNRVIIYPNENVVDNYQPTQKNADEPTPSPYKAYVYTGEEVDGGFIVECADPTDYHELANAIIRTSIQCLMSLLYSVITGLTMMLMRRNGSLIVSLPMLLQLRQNNGSECLYNFICYKCFQYGMQLSAVFYFSPINIFL